MLNSSLVQAINDPEHYRRYGVFILARENDQHIRLTYPLIVLKNGYDMIVEFTRLHEFIPHNSVVINTTSGGTKKHYMMTTMLNYILVDHRPDFHITRFEDISHDMMQSFFTSYATENTIYGIPPMEETVKRCISTCAETMYNVACAMPNVFTSLSPDALLTTKTVMTSRGMQAICSPNFPVEIPATGHLHAMRDIPREVMEFMIPLLYAHAPHIAFGCIASLCAGLRIGEICNMRQPYASISKYGRGISLSYTGSIDFPEKETCLFIIQDAASVLLGEKDSVSEESYASCMRLEGLPETFLSSYHETEGYETDVLSRYPRELETFGLVGGMGDILKLSRLLSNSLYASLEAEENTELSEESYIGTVGTYLKAVREKLDHVTIPYGRAVMARIFTQLPPRFTSQEELETYIYDSLRSCSDAAEKKGTVELLHQIMEE